MQDVNDTFKEFSECFCGTVREEGEIVYFERLARDRLDYSVESLKYVDDYLVFLHSNRVQHMDQEWTRAILWGGAYVGEVIRRNVTREYNWVDFEEFIEQFPRTSELLGTERQLGATALLTPGGGAFTLPINKVVKFIHNGLEDSVSFFAICEIRG